MTSVVLAAYEAGPALEKCITSLLQQDSGSAVPEIIVASTAGEDANTLAAKYPSVRFLHFAQRLPKSALLKNAIAAASGEIVAVTEPDCWFPPGWAKRLQCAHQSEFPVIGGAVTYGGDDSASGWACFLADYGAFLPSEEPRTSSLLAGNHISFKRGILAAVSACWERGYDKTFVLWELQDRGVRFLFEPGLVVCCAPDPEPRRFARKYYANAREFAAARATAFSMARRVAHIAGSPALPFLLLYRRLRAIWTKRAYRVRLLRSLPFMTIFVLCWSAGELSGYFVRRGDAEL
jgi:glycosyltransferase involved in cell wall biosynthesis